MSAVLAALTWLCCIKYIKETRKQTIQGWQKIFYKKPPTNLIQPVVP